MQTKTDIDILPKAGAGQEGTDELVDTYKNDTPGQGERKIDSFNDFVRKTEEK
jgi:hypothetical protein